MSRRGDCWDIAVAELFFSTLKNDLTLDEPDLTPELARSPVLEFIDLLYNPVISHDTLGCSIPIDYELKQISDVSTKAG